MVIGIAFIFSIYESLWRRCYGGWDSEWWRSRGIHALHRPFWNVVNLIAIFALCHWRRDLSWFWSAYIAAVVQFLFWSLSFGMYLDIGRDPLKPGEKEDYDNTPFNFVLDWFFPEGSRYTPFYDFCGMMLRFTWPMLLVFWVPTFNVGMLLLGEIVAVLYGIGWSRDDADPEMKKHKIDAIDLGEFGSGFFVGLFLVLVGM